MNRLLILAASTTLAFALPAFAQDAPPAATMTGTMSAADVGVSPITGLTATNYAEMAAGSDKFEIESARIALNRSSRPDVKQFAQMMIDQHTTSTQQLTGALKNDQRTIKVSSNMALTSEQKSMLTQLRKTPKAGFDNAYLTQQLEAHKKAWAVHKGYATGGEDAPLRQVAANIVPVVESHITQVKALIPAGVGAQ